MPGESRGSKVADRERDFVSRFWNRVDKRGDCWRWTGSTDSSGHGTVRRGSAVVSAHRVAYELEIGEIPVGLIIWPTCRDRLCVKPDHLEAITVKDSLLRRKHPGVDFRKAGGVCSAGHILKANNTFAWADPVTGEVERRCWECEFKVRLQASREAKRLRRK